MLWVLFYGVVVCTCPPAALGLPAKGWKLHPSPETCSVLQDQYFQEMPGRLCPLLQGQLPLVTNQNRVQEPDPIALGYTSSCIQRTVSNWLLVLWIIGKITNNSHLTRLIGENKCSSAFVELTFGLMVGIQWSHSYYSQVLCFLRRKDVICCCCCYCCF